MKKPNEKCVVETINPERSAKLQRHLLKCGYEWPTSGKKVMYTHSDLLFIWEDDDLFYVIYLRDTSARLLTQHEVLSIEPEESQEG